MTHEQKAKWILRISLVAVFVGIVAYVFAPKQPAKPAKEKNAQTQQVNQSQSGGGEFKMVDFNQSGSLKDMKITKGSQIDNLIEEASKKHGSKVLGIVHCHTPGNADSEQTAEILDQVGRKYGSQVLLIRVNIVMFPEFAKAQHVTKTPEVLLLVDNAVAFRIEGLWPRLQIERKVDELIHGLRKVGKDWRPPVPGMQPVGGGAPSPR